MQSWSLFAQFIALLLIVGTCSQVVQPNEGGQQCLTPIQFVQQQPSLQVFATFLLASNISQQLDDVNTAVTVLAPTDNAFREFFTAMQTEFLETYRYISILEPLISYHIIDRVLYKDDLLRGAILDTMIQNQQGKGIIKVDDHDISKLLGQGSPTRIVAWDFPACNSVIHYVDQVLLPVDV
eukprot:TRINITY_DN6184_c0_g1_i2.p3 TRINITY_DN6184_c0_g1~~TRINITY_DN6184_c0_g1_i2.p3  ORF type:complete len:181 (-),score=8.05 TRINITY_DN6184_c0_g1_i2:614-1156(-)